MEVIAMQNDVSNNAVVRWFGPVSRTDVLGLFERAFLAKRGTICVGGRDDDGQQTK